jgi:hypothetical protein
MKQVIVDIIKEGWRKNLPVSEVIRNIASATGLYERFAREQFCELVFIAKEESL